jgi:hypothetical protein
MTFKAHIAIWCFSEYRHMDTPHVTVELNRVPLTGEIFDLTDKLYKDLDRQITKYINNRSWANLEDDRIYEYHWVRIVAYSMETNDYWIVLDDGTIR